MSNREFENAYELMDYLFGTENRIYAFLEQFDEDACEEYLPDDIGADTTLSNKRGELVEAGLLNMIERGNYELTPVGEITANYLYKWMEEAHGITELFTLAPFIRQITDFDEFLDKDEMHYLAGSEIAVQSQESGRNAAKLLYREMLQQSNQIEELIHRTYIPEDFRSELVDGDLDSLKVIFGPEMAEEARNEEIIQNRWRELYENGATHISVPDGIPIDYTVSIFDNEKVGILPTDPAQGQTDVYLVTSDENVLNWASRLIQKYEKQGKEITPPEE